MKDFINKNYDLCVSKIYSTHNDYFFFIGNEKIKIIKTKKDEKYLQHLANVSNKLYNDGLSVDTFILNVKNKFCTALDDSFIFLLKVNNFEQEVSLNSLLKYSKYTANLDSIKVIELFESDVDTLEKELMEYNKEYNKIKESINYFIGLAENSIQLLKSYEDSINKLNKCICHKLNYYLFNNNSIDNPLNFVLANRMYDLSNYIKYNFLKGIIAYDEIDFIIESSNQIERVYLFANMLFPSSYFDLVKNILLNNDNEDKIDIYINKIENYKRLLLYMQNSINNESINKIKWISE